MRIYNSLSRQVEAFHPISDKKVGVYACGPTVYNYLTIGNWRTYILGDLLVRSLTYLGYKVDYVMNITDVGHLTGDNEGDASTGDDRMEKASKREGKSAWELADHYTADFLDGYEKLKLSRPMIFCKATDHIKEQIQMVKKLIQEGLAYETSDGIYFDIGEYELAGNKYGELSNLDEQAQVGARVEKNDEKKDPRDFALWKFSNVKTVEEYAQAVKGRQMSWWFEGKHEAEDIARWRREGNKEIEKIKEEDGKRWVEASENEKKSVGFPGWHIECSAMSQKYLGDQFDIHIGGEDLKSTHHPNEIAQSEAATNKSPFVKYWIHGAFLQVDGGRMGKSLGNAYTLHDLEEKGFDLMALKYLYLTGHYGKPLNFTWGNLEAANIALQRLKNKLALLKGDDSGKALTRKVLKKIHNYRVKFATAINDDLNMPQALALLWEVVKNDDLPPERRVTVAIDFDKVFGLGLHRVKAEVAVDVPKEVMELMERRENARIAQRFDEADEVRREIEQRGFEVIDTINGSALKKKNS